MPRSTRLSFHYYFHRFKTGTNPFGFAALDIKSFDYGAVSCSWRNDTENQVAGCRRACSRSDEPIMMPFMMPKTHQAELFRLARALPKRQLDRGRTELCRNDVCSASKSQSDDCSREG